MNNRKRNGSVRRSRKDGSTHHVRCSWRTQLRSHLPRRRPPPRATHSERLKAPAPLKRFFCLFVSTPIKPAGRICVERCPLRTAEPAGLLAAAGCRNFQSTPPPPPTTEKITHCSYFLSSFPLVLFLTGSPF